MEGEKSMTIPTHPPRLWDPEVRGLVKKLNEQGYPTDSSCAGHKGHVTNSRGYVAFTKVLHPSRHAQIKQICNEFGCRNIRIEVHSDPPTEPKPTSSTYVEFSALGKPWKEWKKTSESRNWKERY